MSELNTADVGFKKQLWNAADYEQVLLGLIFLKYISDKFEVRHQELVEEGEGFEEDLDEYFAKGVFFVPQSARWENIASKAHTAEIGSTIDEPMRSIEK